MIARWLGLSWWQGALLALVMVPGVLEIAWRLCRDRSWWPKEWPR